MAFARSSNSRYAGLLDLRRASATPAPILARTAPVWLRLQLSSLPSGSPRSISQHLHKRGISLLSPHSLSPLWDWEDSPFSPPRQHRFLIPPPVELDSATARCTALPLLWLPSAVLRLAPMDPVSQATDRAARST